ncbi:hypothetical protein MBCUR_05940 [Methanobrevibacter curvatus]|uniref:Uncharacterized protein n=1 Tax=Methanobrevibacter curvatus TaxID=49547 RepID=A0A166C893_9EURY|nr:hypothetical protein MBCUR_05940 [Methanobrevibacter curvatus]
MNKFLSFQPYFFIFFFSFFVYLFFLKCSLILSSTIFSKWNMHSWCFSKPKFLIGAVYAGWWSVVMHFLLFFGIFSCKNFFTFSELDLSCILIDIVWLVVESINCPLNFLFFFIVRCCSSNSKYPLKSSVLKFNSFLFPIFSILWIDWWEIEISSSL